MERDSVLQLRLIVAGVKADVEARVAACTPGELAHALPERGTASQDPRHPPP